MKSWPLVEVPKSVTSSQPLKIFSTAAQAIVELPIKKKYQMYVCGITPYDATHLGHAATYLTFDIVNRYLISLGAEVNYIQNITDIDDPLLERAIRDGVDWRELATSQIDLFRSDMTYLRVIPPTHYEGAVDAIPDVVTAIEKLASADSVYDVDSDKYFEIHKDSDFGSESHLPESEMLEIFAERGGDPKRVGKRDPLDALLWLSKRPNEPFWPSTFGEGRPGWHIECAAIALKYADVNQNEEYVLDIQGGGSDLIFPHHEMSASQTKLLTGKKLANAYVHAGLIGLDGEKMSKSKGNLVFVSKLISDGVNPMAIRWALLKRHYRNEYMWNRSETMYAQQELDAFSARISSGKCAPTDQLIASIKSAIANDLNTPAAIAELNSWADLSGDQRDVSELIETLDALLGITLSA